MLTCWQIDCDIQIDTLDREGDAMVKPIFALLALILIFSIPAHAQAGGGSTTTVRSSGGGAFGGGGEISTSAGAQHSHNPPAQFQMAAISGSSSDFVPSAYLPFEKAVALGHDLSTTRPATIVEVAQANRITKGSNPERVIVQDSRGNLVEDSK
jgi:hypothetical protein